MTSPIRPMAAAIFITMTTSCLAESAPLSRTRDSLTVAPSVHTVQCANPKREICVIKKPVGSGYRLLTQGIQLEDSGEFWLADFSKATKEKAPALKKSSFRVMGKDHDLHEIEITFLDKTPRKDKPTGKVSTRAGDGANKSSN